MANQGALPPPGQAGQNSLKNAANFPAWLFWQSGASSTPQAPLGNLFAGTGTTLKTVVYWGVAALALIALAKPYPNLATGFTVLLIVGVGLTHYSDYLGLFSVPKK